MTSDDCRVPPPEREDDDAMREYGRQLAMDSLLDYALSGAATKARRGGVRGRRFVRRRPAPGRLVRLVKYAVLPISVAAAVLLLIHRHGVHDVQGARAAVSATVVEATGAADLVGGTASRPASVGAVLAPGEGLRTGTAAVVKLRYPDDSSLELRERSTLHLGDLERSREAVKRVLLDAGTLVVEVNPRLKGSPMVVRTPHAEATALQTRFSLSVEPDRTRLEVDEGKVRLRRTSDGRTADVPAGFFTLAGPGLDLVVRPSPRVPRDGQPLPTDELQGNLLVNGSFEAAHLERWRPFGEPRPPQVSLDMGEAYSGRQAVRLSNEAKTHGGIEQGVWLKQREAVPLVVKAAARRMTAGTPPADYSFGVSISCCYMDGSTKWETFEQTCFDPTKTGWQTVEWVWQPPKPVRFAEVRVMYSDPGHVLFDAVYVAEKAP